MADHSLEFALYYDGAWHPAPVYVRDGCTIMRGIKRPGDSDPSLAAVTLDNRAVPPLYSPRSIVSPLYGKIGQNTPGRLTVDGGVRMVGEAASWIPGRVVGDAWTKLELAGVLQRIGRGTDPLRSAVRRAVTADGPVAYWPLTDAGDATQAASGLAGGAPMLIAAGGTVAFAAVDGPIEAGDESFPEFIKNGAYSGSLVGPVPVVAGASTWQFEGWFNCTTLLTAGIDGLPFTVLLSGNGVAAKMDIILQGEGRVTVYYRDASDTIVYAEATPLGLAITDGKWHQVRVVATQTGGTWTSQAYLDGALYWTDTGIAGSIGFPGAVYTSGFWDPFGITIPSSLSTGHIAVGTVDADHYTAGRGYDGEAADDRFERICLEEGIASTVTGAAFQSVLMGPQRPVTRLELFDEIARTDDASIFETRGAIGLTMRTGQSKLNQSPDLVLSYLGQIVPDLQPIYGDEGIRNDVTAVSPSGAQARVEQATGPHNTQLPEDDPQGVGRYTTRLDVNPATVAGLADAAGWRVAQGTYDGTWYAEITADFDAAPEIASAAASIEIGDVIELVNTPVDEALNAVRGLVIGIGETVLPKRRKITFYCAPAAVYQVGLLATTSGDTGEFLGHLDTDGSTTVGATAAGAASFSVATTTGPIWTTLADDFPFDVIAGGQRVSISAIAGASSPQTFTVATFAGAYPVAYAIPAGSAVTVQQPIILSL